ncbi:MAG: hypothetical protein KJ927_14110 [Candidatus Eisenbacteria bacterium]|nr:hypothetical protein [Candidatus Eisenbacteria bacterium]MBU1949843.1 hypothetical protein [Candidatus Eisenbacteria bacterium]
MTRDSNFPGPKLIPVPSSNHRPGIPRPRRLFRDRRRHPTPILSRFTFRGRRRGARRDGEVVGLYIDRLSPGIVWPLLLIFVFHCIDAVLTLAHIQRGGVELNPFMALLIDAAPAAFISVKLGLSTFGLLFLGLHQNFPHVRKGIAALFAIFLCVVLYHIFLLIQIAVS